MNKIIYALAVLSLVTTPAFPADKKAATKPTGPRFEISFGKEIGATPIDGHESDNIHWAPRFVAASSPAPNALTYAEAQGSVDLRNSWGLRIVTSFPASISAIRDPRRNAS